MALPQKVVLVLLFAAVVVGGWFIVDRNRRNQEIHARCEAAVSAQERVRAKLRDRRYGEALPLAREYAQSLEAIHSRGETCNLAEPDFLTYFMVQNIRLEVLSGKIAFADIDPLYPLLAPKREQREWASVRDGLDVSFQEAIPTTVVYQAKLGEAEVEPHQWDLVRAPILLAAHDALAPKGIVWGDALGKAERTVAPLRVEVSIAWKEYLMSPKTAWAAEAMTLVISRPGHRSVRIEVAQKLPDTMSFRTSGRDWDSAWFLARSAAAELEDRGLRDLL